MGVLQTYLNSRWQISGLTSVCPILLHECTILPTTPESRHEMINNERDFIQVKFARSSCPAIGGDLLEEFRHMIERGRIHSSVDLCVLNGEAVMPITFVECKYRVGDLTGLGRKLEMRHLFVSIQAKFRHMKAFFHRDQIGYSAKRYVVFSNRVAPLFKAAYNDYCMGRGKRLAYRIVSTSELQESLKTDGLPI